MSSTAALWKVTQNFTGITWRALCDIVGNSRAEDQLSEGLVRSVANLHINMATKY